MCYKALSFTSNSDLKSKMMDFHVEVRMLASKLLETKSQMLNNLSSIKNNV